MAQEKSLRDIWVATDQSTIDILKDSGELSQNIPSDNKSSPMKQSQISWPKTMQLKSSNLKEDNAKDVQGLFHHGSSTFEGDNVSLQSIWTPTYQDNLKKEPQNAYESPLIDLETPENSNPESISTFTLCKEYTSGVFEDPLIDLESSRNLNPKQSNIPPEDSICGIYENRLKDIEISTDFHRKHGDINTLSEDYNIQTFESSPLIDLEILRNCNPEQKSVHVLIKETGGNTFRCYSDKQQRIDCGLEKSLDKLNEETFGECSSSLNDPELTLSDISEATMACILSEENSTYKSLKKPSTKNQVNHRTFEYSKTLKDMQENQEKTTGTKSKTFITKVYKQNSLHQCYPLKGVKENTERNPKAQKGNQKGSFSNISHVTSTSEGILSRENLTIRKVKPLQGKFKRYNPNEMRKIATRTHETFHREVSSEQHPEEIATRTRETFHTKGEMSYYTSEKITYFRGEKLGNKDKQIENGHKKNIVWKNDICDFALKSDKKMNHDTRTKRHSRSKSIANHHDKGRKLSNPNNLIYEEYTPSAHETVQFKNINGSKRHEQKQFLREHQGNPSQNENENASLPSQDFWNSSEDETATKCLWQSPTDKLKDFDKLSNVSQNRAYGYNGNQSCRTDDIKHRDKHNATHFNVYDPNINSHFRNKIVINQYAKHMKYKNSFLNNTQREKTEIVNKTTRVSPNQELQDHFKFSDPHNLKKENENKTFVKDIQIGSNNNSNITDSVEYLTKEAESNDKTILKSSIIRHAKEIAELIAGCERGLDIFKSFYDEWIEMRKQSISLLEQIVLIIDQSSRKSNTMKHVIAAINIAAGAANVIPHAGVAMGIKLAGIVANFFKGFGTDSQKDVKAKKYEIREIFQRDINSSSYVYLYGVQCSTQFQETCNIIDKFHKQLLEERYQSVIDDDDVHEFMNELSEYNNSNTILFYKKLRICYEKLIKGSKSKDSRAFIRVFEDVPNAVKVIELLPWKFDSQGIDNSVVQEAWEELFLLFHDDNEATIDIIKDKVHNCLFFLQKEHLILSRNVVNLFKETCLKERKD